MYIRKGVRYMIAERVRGWGHFYGQVAATALHDDTVSLTNKASAKFVLDDDTVVQRSYNGIKTQTEYGPTGTYMGHIALTEEAYKAQQAKHVAAKQTEENLMAPFVAFAEMFNEKLRDRGVVLTDPTTWVYLDTPHDSTPSIKNEINVTLQVDYGTLRRIAPLLIHALCEQDSLSERQT